ncbi:hypothetical protein EJB05_03846, partial [Eragrostis curvula]
MEQARTETGKRSVDRHQLFRLFTSRAIPSQAAKRPCSGGGRRRTPLLLRSGQERIMENDVMLQLPMDIIYKIPSHLSDPASLARLASSCKFWRNLIKDPEFLDYLKKQRHTHGFTPSLLLGFFYQDSTEPPSHFQRHHKDKLSSLAPRFMPMSELSQFIGSKADKNAVEPPSLGTFIRGLGEKLNFYEPIASQDGFLALRRRVLDARTQQCELSVCNPLTGEFFCISPPLESPDRYVLLATENVSHNGRTTQSFQLVAIWIKNRRRFVTRAYCSKARDWIWYGRAPELMSGLYVMPCPAAVSRGAIHFLCGCWENWTLSHLTTLHLERQELSYLPLPPDASRNKAPLLTCSADGGLMLLYSKGHQLSLWKHDNAVRLWVLAKTIDVANSLPPRAVQMQARARVIRLESFHGKSGAVVLCVEREGRYLFSFSDGSMRKIDNDNGRKNGSLCPYEIDWLSSLAIMNLVVDGSLSRDIGRKMIRGRWRTLMGRHMNQNQRHGNGKA